MPGVGGKPRLLLYLSRDGEPRDAAIIPTLARISSTAGCGFDAYLEGARAGTHYGGGDPAGSQRSALLGGTVLAGRHQEAAASLAARNEVFLAIRGSSILEPFLTVHGARVVSRTDDTAALYRETADALGVSPPRGIALIVAPERNELAGIEYYSAPIAYESGRAVFLAGDTAAERWPDDGRPAMGLLAAPPRGGDHCPVVARLETDDDYASATLRLLRARSGSPEGFVLGDPPLVAHWLPWILQEGYAPLYGMPLSRIVEPLADELREAGRVLGRVFEDGDFFCLAEHGAALQVIDPERPPFPAAGPPPPAWPVPPSPNGTVEPIAPDSPARAGTGEPVSSPRATDPWGEPDDARLEELARGGSVLVTLAFWAGAIREIETLYALFDLVATTGLRCGVALTSDSYRYGGSVVPLLAAPREAGGVFPDVEPLLGSAGDGITLECLMPSAALRGRIEAAMACIRELAPAPFVPRGWWCTMDARLVPRPRRRSPRRLEWHGRDSARGSRLRLRYHKRRAQGSGQVAGPQGTSEQRERGGARESVKGWLRSRGAERYFEAYRPFEFLEPGEVSQDVWDAGAAGGLEYVLTKSAFGSGPVAAGDEEFIAINHTAGRWDGWTPFETINDVVDLQEAERQLLSRGGPGWVLSTVDTCLWAFSGEMWKRGAALRDIAVFCASGGASGRLVPALPRTVARYASICRRLGLLPGVARSAGA